MRDNEMITRWGPSHLSFASSEVAAVSSHLRASSLIGISSVGLQILLTNTCRLWIITCTFVNRRNNDVTWCLDLLAEIAGSRRSLQPWHEARKDSLSRRCGLAHQLAECGSSMRPSE